MIGDYLRFYSDSVVIGKVLTVALVTPFSVAARLMEYMKSVVVAAGGPLLGEMSELDGKQRNAELGQLLLRSTRIFTLLALLGGLLLLLDGKALIAVWVGKEQLSAYPLLIVLTVVYIIGLAQHPSLLITIARARHGPLGWWTVVEGTANLLLSIYWARTYGILGVALGTAVPMLLIKTTVQPYYALAAANLWLWDYVKKGFARPLAVGAVFTTACLLIGIPSVDSGFMRFVVTVFLQSLFFLVLSFLFGLTKEERIAMQLRFFNLGTIRGGPRSILQGEVDRG